MGKGKSKLGLNGSGLCTLSAKTNGQTVSQICQNYMGNLFKIETFSAFHFGVTHILSFTLWGTLKALPCGESLALYESITFTFSFSRSINKALWLHWSSSDGQRSRLTVLFRQKHISLSPGQEPKSQTKDKVLHQRSQVGLFRCSRQSLPSQTPSPPPTSRHFPQRVQERRRRRAVAFLHEGSISFHRTTSLRAIHKLGL